MYHYLILCQACVWVEVSHNTTKTVVVSEIEPYILKRIVSGLLLYVDFCILVDRFPIFHHSFALRQGLKLIAPA